MCEEKKRPYDVLGILLSKGPVKTVILNPDFEVEVIHVEDEEDKKK